MRPLSIICSLENATMTGSANLTRRSACVTSVSAVMASPSLSVFNVVAELSKLIT